LCAVLVLGAEDLLHAQPGLPPPSPREVLEQHGLIRQGTGGLWIVASEVDLQRQLAVLSDGENEVKQHGKQLVSRIDQNRSDWAALSGARKSLKSAKSDARKRSLKKQIKQLAETCVKPEELAGERDVHNLLIHFVTERNRLLLSVLAARRDFEFMARQYERLDENRDVQKALLDLKQDARLGPARSYDDAMRQLDELESVLTGDWQPLLQQSGRWRVNGIVAERAATTFTWDPQVDRVLLSGTAARLAGLPAGQGTETEIRVERRKVTARRIVLRNLRFGSCVLHDVDALVLPPEAEDLGSRIGPAAFGELKVEIVPARLRLVIGDHH
jgi:hypothetical protein